MATHCSAAITEVRYKFSIKMDVKKNRITTLLNKPSGYILSPAKHIKSCNQTWRIVIEKRPETPDWLGLYLASSDGRQINVAQLTCFIQQKQGYLIQKKCVKVHNKQKEFFGWEDWITESEVMRTDYWNTDILRLSCKVEVAEIIVNSDHQSLEDKLSRMLKSGICSDVTLVVDEEKFKVHRGVLANSCDYFRVMFSGSFVESREAVVELQDVDPSIFKHVLKYIYTNRAPSNMEALALQLLAVADRFGIEDLIKDCEKTISSSINMQNFTDILVYCDHYPRAVLKHSVTNFIDSNYTAVINSDAWKKLKESNLKLAVEVAELLERI